jgi:hypothetical protein
MRKLLALLLALLPALAQAIHSPSIQTIAPSGTVDTPCFPVYTKAAGLPGIIQNAGSPLAAVNLWQLFGAGDSTYTCAGGPVAPTFARTNSSTAQGLAITATDPNSAYYSSTSLVASTTACGSGTCTIGMKATNVNDATGKTLTGTATVAASGSTAIPIAQGSGSRNFFVCPSTPPPGYPVGNDSVSDVQAQSSATPWATIGKVNSYVFQPGDDVWLCAGGVFNQRLLIDWPGVSQSNRTIVGTYYVSNGQPYQLLPDDTTVNPKYMTWSHGVWAMIQGSYRASCRASPTPTCFTGPGAVPASAYDFLVENDGVPYVTVQSLWVKDSAGGGIGMYGWLDGNNYYPSKNQPSTRDYFIAQYNKIDHTNYDNMIFVASTYGIYRGNELGYAGIGQVDGLSRTCPTNANCAPDGGNIYVVHCAPCYFIFENNYVHDTFAETGLGDESFVYFHGNLYGNMRRDGPYLDGTADTLIEQEMMVGGGYRPEPGLGNANTNYGGTAFYDYTIVKESATQAGGNIGTSVGASHRNWIRNNIGVTHQTCLVAGLINDATGDNYFLSGGFFGNTCVGVSGQKSTDFNNSGAGGGVDATEGFKAQNNVLVTTTGVSTCNQQIAQTVLDHNFWVGTPPASCRQPGTGDIYGTWAGLNLNGMTSFTHWNDSDVTKVPVYSDLQPKNTTTAVGAPALTDTILDLASWQWIYDNIGWWPACATGKPSAAKWAQRLVIDYCNKDRTGAPGAFNALP